jgi:hypothetical protein
VEADHRFSGECRLAVVDGGGGVGVVGSHWADVEKARQRLARDRGRNSGRRRGDGCVFVADV